MTKRARKLLTFFFFFFYFVPYSFFHESSRQRLDRLRGIVVQISVVKVNSLDFFFGAGQTSH